MVATIQAYKSTVLLFQDPGPGPQIWTWTLDLDLEKIFSSADKFIDFLVIGDFLQNRLQKLPSHARRASLYETLAISHKAKSNSGDPSSHAIMPRLAIS